MRSAEIRRSFLEFFAGKGHTVVPSDSLIPKGDPTLLFTTAGMVQFKPLYAGAPLEFKRAASCQKCLRAGGKGSDLENVGRTVRHHTFFEMLGNFSFGDYFKEDAIVWAWEFLTQVVKLPVEKIYASVFQDDDEAFAVWKENVGLDAGHIVRLGEKDNFWGPAGDTGACGPSSEIYYDLGASRGCQKPGCAPGCDCERYIEVWNLVFPQFDQQAHGQRKPLARRGIDTGMGLERIAFIAQDLQNNYQSDLFAPIIKEIARHTAHSYAPETQVSYHVIADHVRAVTFAIADHVIPSNEGRGYVIRRILRRASRHSQKLEVQGPLLYKLVPVVVDIMKEVYPDLAAARENVASVVKFEEERFLGTISFGLAVLEDYLKTSESRIISGEDLFRLYDTYGFPIEMARELAQEEGFSIDEDAFRKLMHESKERSRASWVGKAQVDRLVEFEELKAHVGATEFVGYDSLSSDGLVLAILKEGERVQEARPGEKVEIILNCSPFYGESGGQIGDRGSLKSAGADVEIESAQWPVEGLTLHRGTVKKGVITAGDEVYASVDPLLRAATARHHTATHLLHFALRKVLGGHVKQAGSLVAPDRFRFDFNHFSKVRDAELENVESLINEKIVENIPLRTFVVPMEEAKRLGALMFFGDKYGPVVRVVDIGGFSKELCGGTHVKATGDIGLFKILTESSVASGVRRLEAVSGLKAYETIRQASQTLSELCSVLSASPQELLGRMERLLSEKRQLEKLIEAHQREMAKDRVSQIITNPLRVQDIPVYVGTFENLDAEGLRNVSDQFKSRIASGVIILASSTPERVYFLATVSPDCIQKRVHAGKIVQELARRVDGGGGGRPESAQAGGKTPSKLHEALKDIPRIISGQMTHS